MTPPADGDPEQDLPRFLVPAEIRRHEERALEAAAEAPIPVEFPLVDAIGIPLEERPGVSEPAFVPAPVWIVDQPSVPVDAVVPGVPLGPIPGPPCCQDLTEMHPPDAREPEEPPPVLVGAKVKSRDERALEAAAEAPIPAEVPLVEVIGIPLEERPGVSKPEIVPASTGDRPAWLSVMKANAELIIALFVMLLAIGFLLSRRRRPRRELEAAPVPARRPPLPYELLRPLTMPVPLFEPVTAPPVEAVPARELEPA